MTKQTSGYLGGKKYKEVLSGSGLTVLREFKDEGENHYFEALKKR